ncbi:MAG: DUF1571 domain-containing protein [Planctomycetes bacterium]|nr:DUF1571 domain-containing protein [Planctomycetota bacterium]
MASWCVLASPLAAVLAVTVMCDAQQPRDVRLQEPVYRVTKRTSQPAKAAEAEHPLDPALRVAREGLERIRRDVRDYTCTIAKRERVGDVLGEYEYMFAKIRNGKEVDGREVVPFSVYLSFLKPDEIKGREVIYVKGHNGNKLCGHEGGLKGKWLPTVWLPPDGAFAMRGQRYPIYDIGIENLVEKLIEKGETQRKYPNVDVKFYNNAKVNGRSCTCIQLLHPERHADLDFHVARIYIDDELKLPIRYEAYDWPKTASGKPELLEEYTYIDLKINVGLTDADFDVKNPNYAF